MLCCADVPVLLQLVAVACLYLGSKVMESPKYLRDVIKLAEIRKWAKWCDDHPTERRKWEDMVRRDRLGQGLPWLHHTHCFTQSTRLCSLLKLCLALRICGSRTPYFARVW
jgi:hypothetical protein